MIIDPEDAPDDLGCGTGAWDLRDRRGGFRQIVVLSARSYPRRFLAGYEQIWVLARNFGKAVDVGQSACSASGSGCCVIGYYTSYRQTLTTNTSEAAWGLELVVCHAKRIF